jgi:HAD superfamily hydrolase (TIGR01484 family)
MKLLCTDLDRTLMPNGVAVESPKARPILWHLLRSHDMALAYVSGRDLQRVLDAITDYGLRIPDVIVADVGTSVYVPGDGGWQPHPGWASIISTDWDGLDSEGIRYCLRGFDELQDQEPDRQSRFKRSYYLSREIDTEKLQKPLGEHLLARGLRAALVFSDDPLKGVQLLDVLPLNATKRDALMQVQAIVGATGAQTLFSGDSGNDVSALASDLPSVTVRNADQKTRDAVRQLARRNGTEQSTYQATGSLELADGDELNGNYAAGIVEGLVHFNPSWMDDLRSIDWIQAAMRTGAQAGVHEGLQGGVQSGVQVDIGAAVVPPARRGGTA